MVPAAAPPLIQAADGGWRSTGSLQDGRCNHTATLMVGGTVLVAGGQQDSEDFPVCLRSCELYDPAGGLWCGAAVLEVGGRNESGPLARAENYDLLIHPTPVLEKINPSSAPSGSPGMDLTAFGSGFTVDSRVRWNGRDRDTTFVNPSELKASLPEASFTESGSADITVFTPSPGGGTSEGIVFTITKRGGIVSQNKEFEAIAGPGGRIRFCSPGPGCPLYEKIGRPVEQPGNQDGISQFPESGCVCFFRGDRRARDGGRSGR